MMQSKDNYLYYLKDSPEHNKLKKKKQEQEK